MTPRRWSIDEDAETKKSDIPSPLTSPALAIPPNPAARPETPSSTTPRPTKSPRSIVPAGSPDRTIAGIQKRRKHASSNATRRVGIELLDGFVITVSHRGDLETTARLHLPSHLAFGALRTTPETP